MDAMLERAAHELLPEGIELGGAIGPMGQGIDHQQRGRLGLLMVDVVIEEVADHQDIPIAVGECFVEKFFRLVRAAGGIEHLRQGKRDRAVAGTLLKDSLKLGNDLIFLAELLVNSAKKLDGISAGAMAGNQLGGQGAGLLFLFQTDERVNDMRLIIEIIRLARGGKLIAFERILIVAVLLIQLADLHVDPFRASHDEIQIGIAANVEPAGNLGKKLRVLLEGGDVVPFVLKGFSEQEIHHGRSLGAKGIFGSLNSKAQVFDRLFDVAFDQILAAELELSFQIVGLKLSRSFQTRDGHIDASARGQIGHSEGVIDLGGIFIDLQSAAEGFDRLGRLAILKESPALSIKLKRGQGGTGCRLRGRVQLG